MSRQIVTFLAGKALLGLDIRVVKEVYRHMELTAIPGAPDHLSGLMNLRGRVVTVVNLNVCLNRPKSEKMGENKLLILKTNSEIIQYQNQGQMENVNLGEDIVGFLIDSVEDVLDIEEEDILPAPPNLDTVDREHIEGVIKLGKKLVLLLDINSVLERVVALASSAE